MECAFGEEQRLERGTGMVHSCDVTLLRPPRSFRAFERLLLLARASVFTLATLQLTTLLTVLLTSSACSGKQTGDEGENHGRPAAVVENEKPLRPPTEVVVPKQLPGAALSTEEPCDAGADGGEDGGCQP